MIYIKQLKLFTLLACLFCSSGLWANTDEKLMRLEADMLKYFSTNERGTFLDVTNKLMKASSNAGQDKLFYKAWSTQAIYEATQQNYQRAFTIANDIMDHARETNSLLGEYTYLHTNATVLLQKQDYAEAEHAFLEAVAFSHEHFPMESAGADLQELMKIANHRKDGKAAVKYARQILEEPNVAPIHKGRALYRLSQTAFNKNDTAEFNHIYDEMMKLKKSDGISTLRPIVEVNHYIINGEFEKALHLTEKLSNEERAERNAIIYHRMGDEAKAFKSLMEYKKISDSIILVSHGNMVANCYVQMNNERLQLEQHLLEMQNHKLRSRLYLSLLACFVIFLLFIIFRGRRTIKLLEKHNLSLMYNQKDVERALKNVTELSMYDSSASLPLTTTVQPNAMCNRLTAASQVHCRRGVVAVFMTQLPDNFEFKTNRDALEKLLKHLLDSAARHTRKGNITLSCSESGDNVRFAIFNPGPGLDNNKTTNVFEKLTDAGDKVQSLSMTFNICHSITRLLQGRIWLDNEYTNGIRFCVEVPKEPK